MEKVERHFLYSGILHVGILAFLAIRVAFFPTEIKKMERSVRVDVVALPDKITAAEPLQEKSENKPEPQPSPKLKKEIVEKAKPKEEPTVDLLKKEVLKQKPKDLSKSQDSAIDRLKSIAKIKAKVEQKNQQLIKGNVINEGSSLTGLMKLKHDEYLERLDNHIKSFWNLPEWLNNQNLKAIFRIRFNATGNLIDLTVLRSSQNEIFDQKAKESIEKSMPVPPPPDNLVDYYETRGLELRFPD